MEFERPADEIWLHNKLFTQFSLPEGMQRMLQ